MKKISFFIFFLILPMFLWAMSGRTVIPLSSPLYRQIDNLCYELGRTHAESVRPWSAAEFRRVLDRLDYEALSYTGKAVYSYIMDELSGDEVLFKEEHLSLDASVRIAPEAFYHFELEDTNNTDAQAYEWQHGYEERQSFLTVPLEFFYDEALYLVLTPELKEEYNTVTCADAPETALNYFNVIFDDPTIRIDTYFPFRSVMSFGGEWWDLFLGRDDLSWGNGMSSNMMLSDYDDFHDFLMLKLRSDSVTFTSVYSILNHYTPDDTEAFLGHRLEGSFLDGRIRAAVSESLVINDISWETLRDLNFLMVYHNWNLPDRTNALAALELSINPYKYFNIYGQIAMDEFQTPYEGERDGGGGPPVFGYLAGLKGSYPLGPGYLDFTGEWAMTSPWLYNRSSSPYYYNTRRYWSFVTDSMVDVRKPLGYEYGPDSIVWFFDFAYSVMNRWAAGINLTYLIQGEKDLASDYEPTLETTPTGIPENSLILHLSGEYDIFSFLKAGADFYWITTENADHITGSKRNDIELAVSLIYTL